MSTKTKEYRDQVATVAQEYYNSSDADTFYYTIWGGEDIHIGLYEGEDHSIFDAGRQTVKLMAAQLGNLSPEAKVIDIGAGYGGSARFLAREYGCSVVALNISEVENERDRRKNRGQGLDHLIDVVDGSFEDISYEADTFDAVWSQDAILHSGNRRRVLEEIGRVLKPGGELVFTDPMMADDCPTDVLQPILDRIHLDSLGSPGFYRKELERLGFTEVGFLDHTHQLPVHYGRVLRETERNEPKLREVVSGEYIDRMKNGLRHWVEGGEKGRLVWGVFHFRKQR
ncbi:MAG: methyltransferase domain-containing protein [Spirochaetaceae bacterium]